MNATINIVGRVQEDRLNVEQPRVLRNGNGRERRNGCRSRSQPDCRSNGNGSNHGARVGGRNADRSDALMSFVVSQALELSMWASGCALVLIGGSGRPEVRCTRGLAHHEQDLLRSQLQRDLSPGKAVTLSCPFLSDEAETPQDRSEPGTPRMLYCPLTSTDGCVGWLIFIMPQWATVRSEDIEATWAFAKQAALAIDLVSPEEDKQKDSLARLGDQRRQLTRSEIFLRRYQGFVYRIARRFSFPGAEIEDVLQEGRIGLLKAIRSYDPLRGLSFDEFANLCIRNEIQAAFRRAARQNQVLTVPLECENSHVDVADADLSPEERCCAKASREGIVGMVCSRLHGMERDVFLLYLEGLSPSEISNRLRLTSKQVDNAFQRAKKRLRRAVLDGNLKRDHVTFNVEEIMNARVA